MLLGKMRPAGCTPEYFLPYTIQRNYYSYL